MRDERQAKEDEENKNRKESGEKKRGKERGYFGLNGEFIYKRSAFRSIRRS